MDVADVELWFGEYLAAFAACARGDNETDSLVAYYGVPLLIVTDAGYFPLISADQVVAGVGPQIDGLRAAGYDHSDVLGLELTAVNAVSALLRGTFSWQRADDSEISQVTATYLVTDGPDGRRISVLAVHSA